VPCSVERRAEQPALTVLVALAEPAVDPGGYWLKATSVWPAQPADTDDQPFLLREVVCELLADIGPEAREALPALLRCADDETDSTVAKSMRLSAARAAWKISGDPSVYIPICKQLLLDQECWFRRHVVELLEEVANPAALPALRERLVDARPEVRQVAVRAIAKIGFKS